ncbi:MAG: tetratricopeptide repeat protein [Bdellovibrionota bacterium]
MSTKSFSDVVAENWKLVLGAALAALVLIAGVSLWKEHNQSRELAATNALYDAQIQAKDLLAAKQMDQAEKSFAKLLADYPGSRAAYEAELQIGDFWMDAKNFDKAAEHYEKASKLGKDAFSKLMAHYNLGVAQESAGKFKEAIATYEEAIKTEGSDFLRPEVLMAQGRCYEALKENQKAIEVYKTVQEKFATRSYYSGAASAFEKQLAAKRL